MRFLVFILELVYRVQTEAPISEESPKNLLSPYAETKLILETSKTLCAGMRALMGFAPSACDISMPRARTRKASWANGTIRKLT